MTEYVVFLLLGMLGGLAAYAIGGALWLLAFWAANNPDLLALL